jgi:hypothetical protein
MQLEAFRRPNAPCREANGISAPPHGPVPRAERARGSLGGQGRWAHDADDVA